MPGILMIAPQRALTTVGMLAPGAGYKATFFASGTTTPVTVYQDSAGSVAHAQPVVANSAGVFAPIYADGLIKCVIVTAQDAAYATIDPVPVVGIAASAAADIGFAPTAVNTATTVQDAIENIDAALSPAGRALVDDADAAAQRTTLGLGALATLASITTAQIAAATLVTEAEGIGSNDNDTTLPTSAAVKDYVDSNAIGFGQTWQNVTGSRAHSTSYQNTTGKEIFVALRGDGSADVQVSPDNSTWFPVGVTSNTSMNGVQFKVPNGHYYRINGTSTITWWTEFR